MTVSNISIAQAATYHGKDDYYSRTITQEDFWYGQGLLSPLGSDIPNPNHSTKTPLSNADYLSKLSTFKEYFPPNSKKLAIDLTFSPPKSISIAMMEPSLKYILIEAHNTAVKNTLDFIENNYIIWRKHTNKDNLTKNIKTRNGLFACLQHRVSREQDPQLHTHCLLFRKTMINEKMMTIEDRFIHSNQYLFSLMYDNELSKALQDCKIPLKESSSEDIKNYHFEIDGINDSLINHFSKRKLQIKEYQKEYNLPDTWDGAHAAGLASRKNKSSENLQSLEKQWCQEIKELGGFQIQKTHSHSEQLRTFKINEIMKQSIKILEEKTYAFSKADIMIEVYKEGMLLGITQQELENSFVNNLHTTLLKAGFRTLDNQEYFTTPKNIERAKYIDNILIQERTENYSTISQNLSVEKIEQISSNLKHNQGWELSQGQKDAVKLMLSSPNKFIAIEGIAGSGKTTMLEQAKILLEEQGVKVLGMAFTGKAAEAMESEACIGSQTIHKHLNKLSPSTTQDTWDFSTVKKASTPEVWIVDESSMLNDHLLSNILDASEKRNAKVVFLGDSNQLLPIGTGNAFARMTQKDAEQVPTVQMREINRQEEGSNLRKTVEALSGKFENIDKSSPLSHIEENIKEIPQRQYRINSIIAEYCKYDKTKRDNTAILVARNNDRNELNSAIHYRLVKDNYLSKEYSLPSINQYGKEENKSYSIGEKIIFTKNDYKLKNTSGETIGVKNGQLGKITDIQGHKVTVQINPNQNIIVDTRSYKHFDYGYAITSFKAQGVTVENALILHDSTQRSSNTRNKIYVDISRAKKTVKIFTDNYKALSKQAKRFQQKIISDTFTNSDKNQERTPEHVKEAKAKTL